MCTLQDHIDRDQRLQTARKQEPIYAALAQEHGIPYEPPTGPRTGAFFMP
ncbi:hypothetical protein PP356_gp46 [Arthrobacter phage MargaretKali]|uniref:Uncharacterized protein n=1 Tax=Arthrobacter phage MargaretKali TaxID=2250414 RepID=A0A345KN24_9CAUD|nr:hypothetical protein PP356_gp46 [Arthrobacter phage MargaretKali]AXH44426.1 hypothetical protein SEA_MARGARETKALI_46 [Arthrobacter phage MargaretKali]